LAYLLSRPDDWKVLVNDLKRRGNLGRDGIYALLRELRNAGYVRFERQRDSQGRMRGGTYIVSEIPAPHPDVPHAVGPEKAVPRLVQPDALPNTDGNPRTTTTNRPTDTDRGTDVNRHRQALQFPEWVPQEIHTAAQQIVAGLDHPDAQLVIDEWAGALAAGVIHRSPPGYLKTLAARCRAGDMSVRYAIEQLL